ncbi:MAG: hypothetical protein LAT63_07960 [Marinobacter sp.]|nr:hypothetical protein [Marinobacter sp.]
MRAWQRWLIGVLLGFSLSGCTTYTYLPEPGEPRSLQLSTLKVSEAGRMHVPVAAAPNTRTQVWASHGRTLPVVDRIDGWGNEAPDTAPAQLNVHVKSEWLPRTRDAVSLIFFFLTATIVPATETDQLTITTELRADDGTLLFQEQSQRRLRRNTSFYSPFPFFMGGRERAAQSRAIHSALSEHYAALMEVTIMQRLAHDELLAGPNDAEAKRAWLTRHHDNMFRPQVLQELAALAPAGAEAAWHRDNTAFFFDYAELLEGEHQLWGIGPPGRRPADVVRRLAQGGNEEQIAERIRTDGIPYPEMDVDAQQYLLAGELSPKVLEAMRFSSSSQLAERRQRAEQRQQQEQQHQMEIRRAEIQTRVIAGNGGNFMSPYTSDGVTAEWVNRAINVSMASTTGAAVGGAAGAYAGNRLLSNVPFGGMLGGIAGAQAGQAVGREMAIDRDLVRRTSDLSFVTLEDMATYLVLHYGTNANFSQVINAAEKIYPGLRQAVANAR